MRPGHRVEPEVRSRRGPRRRLRAVGLVLALAVVALAAWVGVRGALAARHLQRARALVPVLEQRVSSGEVSSRDRQTLATLQRETSSARSLTGDLGWSLASRLPLAGDDLAAVRAAAVAVDTVAQRAVPKLLDVASAVRPSQLRPVGGQVPLPALLKARGPLHEAVTALRQAQQTLEPARRSARDGDLMAAVSGPVTALGSSLDRVTQQAVTGERAAELVPSMLGADGERTTLVLFQNLAEARSQGGIAGAYAVVEADHGRLRVTRQGSAADVGAFEHPVLKLPAAAAELYQPQATRFFQNVTQPVDFATTARLAREMLRRAHGTTVDAVVATDPVALSYLLRATGPVALPGGQRLTADNAVSLLLNRVYFTYPDPRAQDAFFAAAALRVFSELTSGTGDAKASLDALARAAGEHRLLVWSAHDDEQRELSQTVLAGSLDQGEQPSAGVYLNDATASKMSYYQRVSATLAPVDCQSGRARDWTLSVHLRSRAPTSELPAYVTGASGSHDIETILYLAGPRGGAVGAVAVDGRPRPVAVQVVNGRSVASLRVVVPPGQERTVRVTLKTASASFAPKITISPSVTPGFSPVTVSPCGKG